MVRSSALAAVIRHSCTTKLPISNTVFTRLLCWASHERASALRPETAHCRSLISHNRLAVPVSCASGLGSLCSWSKKYTPLTFATSGEVASHTRVSAPFSGLRDTGLRIVIPKPISKPLLRNPAADEGRHRTDLGGQPPGAISAQQAPPPAAEGERAGPHHHHGIPGAVLRLTASSNLTGCSTGSSAGLVPCKILCT